MTTPPIVPGPTTAFEAPAPAPAGKSRIPLVVGLVAVVLILAGAIGVGAAYFFTRGGSGLSEQVAQRECRTAIEREAKARAERVGSGSEVLVSIKSIALEETYKSGAGYTVNGVVTVTLTATLIPQQEQAISLSCAATGTDKAPATAVSNR